MGPAGDPTAVVGADLCVHGFENLRAVDASVMPYVTNGNIYAPVMMLAEKAADLIAGNTPLPAEPIPFYRHGTGMPLEDPSRTPAGEPAGEPAGVAG
jgi:choline dehydrogenase